MNDELVKRLRTICPENYYHPMDFAYGAQQVMHEAAYVIERLSQIVDAIPHVCECCVGCEVEPGGGCDSAFVLSPKRAKEYLRKSRWTPVTEQLPEAERKSYWICTDTGYQCECRWTNNQFGIGESDEWSWSLLDIPQYQRVVAWMPLPSPYEPPKEEDDAEFEKMAVVLEEHNRICDACKFQHEGCSGGVHGGPNGPIYPPCTDGKANEYLDKKLLAIVYEELQKEKEEDI